MCVSPDYQRRGLARQLLEQGLSDADKEGVKVWLLASDKGRFVYEKMGFGVLEERVYDFTDVGAAGARRSTVMQREVKGGGEV
jgi:ribosomal protein S18 acetylase RimI-like enzyme